MTRRIAVLTSGVVLLVLFGLLGTTLPVPYVAQVPGPTFNTLGDIEGSPIITVQGRDPNKVSGNLNLTTVGVSRGGAEPRRRRSAAGSTTRSPSSRRRRSTRPAVRAADPGRQPAGLPHLRAGGRERGARAPRLPGEGRRPGGAEGLAVGVRCSPWATPSTRSTARPTPDADTLAKVLTAIPAGTTVTVDTTHLGTPGQVQVTTKAAKDRKGSLLGVSVLAQPSAPFDVSIDVKDVGGPSAGLMLTLGILDLVGSDDLTGGKPSSPAPGPSTPKGTVGPIGGITLKMARPRSIGAQLFLVPADNCAEASRRRRTRGSRWPRWPRWTTR